MQRVGEDVSERLDVVSAKFFVQRQIRGKWVCRCCGLTPATSRRFEQHSRSKRRLS